MDLLRNVLQTVCNAAETCLNTIDQRPDGWIAMTSIVDHDGAVNQATRGKIVMSVYNITREPFASSYVPASARGTGGDQAGMAVTAPPIYLDVHLVFMANFVEKSYPDGLAALSRLIAFFQQTQFLTPRNAPGLAPGIDMLTIDLENLTPVDVNYVMSMLGTRYLPSAFYKLRTIPFASSAMLARAYPVASGQTKLAAG